MGLIKKGELTTQQIVVLIILIASFVVILFFLTNLGLKNESEKDICRNSVVTRGSTVVPNEAFPLNCHTEYICISGDGSCESFSNSEVEIPSEKSKEGVYKILAEKLRECWWMFGEGKINYAGSDLTENLYCSICSQVAFDDSVKDFLGDDELDKDEFANYLSNTPLKKEGGETYSDYLYEGINPLEMYSGNLGKINLDKEYYVVMGVTSEVSTLSWVGVGAATVAGAVFLLPVTVGGAFSISASALILSGTAGGTAGAFIAPVIESSGRDYLRPWLVETNSEKFSKLKCDEIVTLA